MHLLIRVFGAVLLVASAPVVAAPYPIDVDRAMQNYRDLSSGQKSLQDLSAQERVEVREVDRIVRNLPRDTRSLRQRCLDEEIERAGGSPSTLAMRVIEMKCREPG